MTSPTPTNNPVIVPKKLPFLESICWQTADVYRFTLEEMLSRYERGWKYRNLFNNLEDEELNFVQELAKRYKSWLQGLSHTPRAFREQHDIFADLETQFEKREDS